MALDKLTGEHSILFVRSEQFFDLARSKSLWYMQFGIACCAIESMMHASGPRFDFDRMGVFFRSSPRQADVMIVAGTVNLKMAEVVKRLYEQMPEPKYVVAMGACACTGGPFREYPNVYMGVDKIVPVDVYVPGCPPRPEGAQYGFMQLMELIKRRARDRVEQSKEFRAAKRKRGLFKSRSKGQLEAHNAPTILTSQGNSLNTIGDTPSHEDEVLVGSAHSATSDHSDAHPHTTDDSLVVKK